MKIVPCDVENFDDFIRYYRGSYVRFRDEALLVEAPESSSSFRARTMSGDLKVVSFQAMCEHGSFGIPTLGIREYGPSVAYIYMAPTRQSNRGYLPGLCAVSIFNAWGTRISPKPQLSSPEVIKEVLIPTFRKLPEILDKLEAGERIGCALTPNIGVYTTPTASTPIIAFKRNTVGYFVGESPYIYPKFKMFQKVIEKDLGMSVRRVA